MRSVVVATLLVLSAVSHPALAAKLTTPVWGRNSGAAQCRISYFGQKTALPVTVTMVHFADQPGNSYTTVRNFKMGPNNRGVQITQLCDESGGDLSCSRFRCVFDVGNQLPELFQFVGSACDGQQNMGSNYQRCVIAK